MSDEFDGLDMDDIFGRRPSLNEPYSPTPFYLVCLNRNTRDGYDDWRELGLEFATEEAAQVAALVLSRTLPQETYLADEATGSAVTKPLLIGVWERENEHRSVIRSVHVSNPERFDEGVQSMIADIRELVDKRKRPFSS